MVINFTAPPEEPAPKRRKKLPLWPEMPAVHPRFAGKSGLVAPSDTHRDSEKEMSCVTSVLTGTAKCL